MKKIISYAALFLIAFIVTLIGSFQERQALIYGGVIFAGFLVLSIAVYLFKFLMRLIGKSLTSFLYLSALAAIAVVLSLNALISPVIALSSGAVIGVLLLMVSTRALGRKAMTSTIFGEVFSFLTGYELRAYVSERRKAIITDEQKEVESNDYHNIILVLKELGFKSTERKQMALYAVDNSPLDLPIEDKVKIALELQQGRN